MANTTSVQVRGLDEIERRLQQLPEKLRRRSIKTVLQEGLEIIANEARQRAPRRISHGWEAFVDRGTRLAEAIVTKLSVGAMKATGKVGIDYKKVSHGHLLEFGTKPHKIGKIQHPGNRPRPFMRPALDNKGEDSINHMTSQLAKAVEKEV